MSGPHSAGKGDRPRPLSVTAGQFADHWERVDWRPWYRLIQCAETGDWYVIRTDEVPVFVKWCAARKGERHLPGDFAAAKVSGPEGVTFKDWKIV